MGQRESRRAFLAASAGTLAVLAGCTGGPSGGGSGGGGGGGNDGGDGNDGDGGDGATPTDASGPLGGHAAARGIDAQPRLGPPVAEATAVIVAYEDPSCTLCRRFEQGAYPEILSKLVEPGKAAFVWRGYPVVYPWGEPASQALESTYAADESAFWALKDHYYAEQSAFGTDSVYERTESFLSSETDVDAAAVVDDAENRRHDAAVQADLDSGMDAGAGGQTPKFFLFRDGEFRTKVSGPQGYDVFAAALGF